MQQDVGAEDRLDQALGVGADAAGALDPVLAAAVSQVATMLWQVLEHRAALPSSHAGNDQLLPMIKAAKANAKNEPRRALADAGYKSEENFRALEKMGIDAHSGARRGRGIEPARQPSKRPSRPRRIAWNASSLPRAL